MVKKIITWPLLVMVSIYIFVVEEFIWIPAVRLLTWVRTLPMVQSGVVFLGKQKGGFAVVVLIVLPGISIWPVKLFALYLMGHNHAFVGLTVFLSVKVIATALFAQLYTIVGAECEKVKWFHFCGEKIRSLRNWVTSRRTYQEVRTILHQVKVKLKTRKSILKQRFLAILRFKRKHKS